MKKTNKKGFTIVELVIVIVVIAILAAVMIPTFVGLVNQANIANDTAIAKNLNTAAVIANADTFDDALEAAKDAGYLLANINSKAEDCYFVWEDDTNQFILYNLKEAKIIYSNTAVEGDPDDSWMFAVNTSDEESTVKAALPAVTVKRVVVDVKDMTAILAAGGTVYLDESLALDEENLIVLDKDVTTTINLGKSSLNTNGILANTVPITISKGTVNINGGVIGAAGSYVDADGKRVNSPIETLPGSTTNINGTKFNIAENGFALFAGTTNAKDMTVDSTGSMGIYVNGSAQVVLENATIKTAGRCVWSCNLEYIDESAGTVGHIGTAKLTIKSGTYTGGSATWNPIAACGGQIVIEGGTFEGENGIFTLQNACDTESIVVKGGTFNGVEFSELTTVAQWKALCNSGCSVSIADGVVTITK